MTFENAAQYGFTEEYDPRYGLVFMDLELTDIRPSWAVGCAFDNNYGTALGTSGSTLIELRENVIYSTVGYCECSYMVMQRYVILSDCKCTSRKPKYDVYVL